MAKYCGRVGYVITEESESPGRWKEVPTERVYYGDILRNSMRLQQGDRINDDLLMNHQISILADPFAFSNYQHIRYVEIAGALWSVTNVTIQYPRLILDVGRVYNGPVPEDEANG